MNHTVRNDYNHIAIIIFHINSKIILTKKIWILSQRKIVNFVQIVEGRLFNKSKSLFFFLHEVHCKNNFNIKFYSQELNS